MTKKRITLERIYAGAVLQDVWELWTTKDGIESWWGPDGFRVTVRKLDLRPGGEIWENELDLLGKVLNKEKVK